MTEALLFVSVGSLLTLGTATLVIAALTLQNARRYVELAEARMEYLREEQARLVVSLREERQSLKEELEHEREQRLEAQRRAEWANRERLPLRQAQRLLAEGLDQEQHLGTLQDPQREGREWELRTRRDIEHRIDELKREFQELREAQRNREVEREGYSPVSKGTLGGMVGTRGLLEQETLGTGRTPRSASSPPEASEPADTPPEDKKPRLAVWHPHPDDDVSPGTTSSAGQARPMSEAPVKMFRRHYDKYLENYEGYVKLAERLYRMCDNAEVPTGSLAERQWEERLRRVTDGIERTTARLDLLEEYNPELATDDRISRRAGIARSHSDLERNRRNPSRS